VVNIIRFALTAGECQIDIAVDKTAFESRRQVRVYIQRNSRSELVDWTWMINHGVF